MKDDVLKKVIVKLNKLSSWGERLSETLHFHNINAIDFLTELSSKVSDEEFSLLRAYLNIDTLKEKLRSDVVDAQHEYDEANHARVEAGNKLNAVKRAYNSLFGENT